MTTKYRANILFERYEAMGEGDGAGTIDVRPIRSAYASPITLLAAADGNNPLGLAIADRETVSGEAAPPGDFRRLDSTCLQRIAADFGEPADEASLRGILAVEALCTDTDRLAEFQDWYNHTHVPDMLGTGLYHRAHRFENNHPSEGRGTFLATYETDQDAGRAHEVFQIEFRPRWIAMNRIIGSSTR